MAAIEVQQPSNLPAKRKFRSTISSKSKGNKTKNKPNYFPGSNGGAGKKVKIDKRMKQLFRKRARNYNSDDDEEEDEEEESQQKPEKAQYFQDDDHESEITDHKVDSDEDFDDKEEDDDAIGSDDEVDAVQPGITKFVEGCRAFKMAFSKIISAKIPDELPGPILSGHKKLIAEKLAEEESQRTVKGEAKKEKHLVSERGHVKPENFLNAHEKFLIGVATKGVVKLFNAVNKAQHAQKGLDPSRFKDAKALGKRKKEAFFSELRKKTSADASKGTKSTDAEGDDGPSWAPLRDSYMLTNSKLKNWDKMPDNSGVDDADETMPRDSSSDEED